VRCDACVCVCVCVTVCVQVLLRVSVHIAISLYSVTAIVAGVMSFLLPIETKGREMTVSNVREQFMAACIHLLTWMESVQL